MIINKPVFKPHYHVEVLPGEGVLLISETNSRALYGYLYELIAPLLNGERSANDIVDLLTEKVDPSVVYYALYLLDSKGYLAESTPETPVSISSFWHSMEIDPSIAKKNLESCSVSIIGTGDIDTTGMRKALESATLSIASKDIAQLWLVLCEDYQHEELEAINTSALRRKKPWLLLRVGGPQLWLGPLFMPTKTGCWQCLNLRLIRNRAAHSFITYKKGLSSPPLTSIGFLPTSQGALYQMAATAATQFLAGSPCNLVKNVLTIDWASWATQLHRFFPNPYCTACGKVQSPLPKPLLLQPGKAIYTSDGGHRQVSPEKTLKKYEHLVSPITGIVTMVEPVIVTDKVINVFIAGQNKAIKQDKLAFLKQSFRSFSSGKGVTELQAKVSALSEALERYSGELLGGEIRVTCSLKDWPKGEAYHPNDVMNFSEKQYQEREKWNSKESRFNWVPEIYDPEKVVDWTPLWSLIDERHKYLPTQLVYFGSPARDGDNSFYAVSCSNGNASGNTLTEAVLQGFFELVERDAVAIWWYNRIRRPGVAIHTFGEPYLLQLTEHFKKYYNREIWALDLTNDLGIPVFVAISKKLKESMEQIHLGFGCHLDARIALQRAFAELNQMLVFNTDNSKYPIEDKETLAWLKETIAKQPYLAPDTSQSFRRSADFPLQHTGNFLEDFSYCQQLIESLGLDIMVLDQTRLDVGMPVVKVVVPGLRHFWARFAPGRLYDVPVKMGWLKRALLEEELNPISIFF